GATDAPLQSYGYSHIHGALTIPESIGGVTLSYNIPGVTKKLRLDGDVIADIYLGKIKKWDNKAITALNPGVNLPDKSIMVVHRSDGSGTTFTFSDYLSSVSPTWKAKVGKGKSLSWPVGLGGKGNEGVAGLIKENPYSIGYVELAYVIENKMAYATLKNRDGYYVNPTIDTVKAAAAGAILPNGDGIWSNVSIVNSPGKNAYPISTFTYIVEYPDLSALPDMTEPKAKALVGFMWWMVHDGQKYAPGLLYVPLPNKVVKIDEETIKSIKYKGQPVLR
ncbi:MAG TPA: phosphate ABC transporter substrate-binding protein PstS, partial [Euryarchaeota archaeon]|nr:phosphate ABC transporter substrate-binding protein PstS [Euryarchaeota archaeon]